MPLPAPSVFFPPPSATRDEQARWGDLYAGRTIGMPDTDAPDPDLADSRSESTRERRRVRSGLAADIAATSAARVMGSGVNLAIPGDEAADDRLAEIVERGSLHARLHEAAEIAAAFGGAYLRPVADPRVAAEPYITVIDPTRADPTFVDGRLAAATFWTDVRIDKASVWRWVECRDNRVRTIECALYRGTKDNLGKRVPLDAIPETAGLADITPYPDGVASMVEYVANVLPNRRRPASPQGRADVQGAESLCAAVDVILTSLVRDVRLGRARIVVPASALTPNAVASNGATWSAEREVFTTLDIDPTSEQAKITLLQGAIRTAEHIDGALAMVERAVTAAGWSPATFGIGIAGSAESGTALKIREGRTIATVEAKRRYWTPAISRLGFTLLALDAAVFGTPVSPAIPVVSWPAVCDDDPLAAAQTVETLVRARALSVEAAVRRVNPDLDEAGVGAEVARILAENGLAVDGLNLPGEALFAPASSG